MTTRPLPSSPGKSGRRRYLALVVTGGVAMFVGLAVGYALGTVHTLERQLARGDHHGV